MEQPKINRARLEKNLFLLAEIGKNIHGGIDRALGSEADRDARNWLLSYWTEKLNLQPYADGAANLWLSRKGSESLSPIVVGSHHDAVPNGGMYDGAMGVLLATEIMETLLENGIVTKHPFEIVSFTGEEPNPFNVSTLGSKVLCGRLKQNDLAALKNLQDGSSLQETLLKIGGDVNRTDETLLHQGDIAAFLECHIEQGKRLENKVLPLAGVSCIIGIYRENITVAGEANHAGTTVMRDRHDALLAAGELNLKFEEIIKSFGSDEVVGTIGSMSVFPNAANIIPGEVELVLEVRTASPEIKEQIVAKIGEAVKEICEKRGVQIERKVNLDQREMPMNPDVMDAVSRGIQSLGIEPIRLVSMAGHDAANLQRVAKSGMLFVRSKDGKSHCPQEFTEMDDIEKAGNALLHTVLLLDKELN